MVLQGIGESGKAIAKYGYLIKMYGLKGGPLLKFQWIAGCV